MKESQLIHFPPDASQEAVALALLQLIVCAEGKKLDAYFGAGVLVDRKWLLDTYAECLLVIKNPVGRTGS